LAKGPRALFDPHEVNPRVPRDILHTIHGLCMRLCLQPLNGEVYVGSRSQVRAAGHRPEQHDAFYVEFGAQEVCSALRCRTPLPVQLPLVLSVRCISLPTGGAVLLQLV